MPSRVAPEDFDLLLKARPHIEVASHIPGRIRLKFGFSILSAVPEIAERGEDVISAIDGIRDVESNLFARSLTVTYDPEVLPPDWWDRLYGRDDVAAREVVEQLKTSFG
ncbi:HMA2 domain-containing protein [Algihabitans albus]|uniref:HMA2 domain-containing protein n=1 Tax=Algihabitans albus TaxID=2164067 RepID=UPI000E5D2382|nr:heavy-metal-associated domain-containing protein [Algihabitans albus]